MIYKNVFMSKCFGPKIADGESAYPIMYVHLYLVSIIDFHLGRLLPFSHVVDFFPSVRSLSEIVTSETKCRVRSRA